MALSEKVNNMIRAALENMRITSAGGDSPKFNTMIDTIFEEEDLESELQETFSQTEQGQKTDEAVETVGLWRQGNVGEVQKLTQQQFANIRQFALNPFGFLFSVFSKKLVRGAGIVAFAFLIFEAVKFILEELMKPGRFLDRRFRIVAEEQILIFTNRQLQQELRQGFRQIIVSTAQGLRGGRLQISGNLYKPNNIPSDFIDRRRVVDVPNPATQGFINKEPGRRGSGRLG